MTSNPSFVVCLSSCYTSFGAIQREDRRKDMLKQCKALGEEGKVAVRNVRRDGVDSCKKLEKAGEVGEDEMKDGLDTMKEITDKSIKSIDELVGRKETEVMTV